MYHHGGGLILFGGVLDLARKKQPSCGVLSKGFLAVADIARGLRQLIGGLLFGLGPIALATLAFEHTNRHSRPRVHHLPDDPWLSAALALGFV
jgi:hypothetical protein